MKKKPPEIPDFQNLVAKHAREFNKCAVHRDRTKFNRKQKHRKSDHDAFFVIDISEKACIIV